MIKIDNKDKCCGCKTCEIVCPRSCISFDKDSVGALYPKIDKANCIKCGKCESVCPMLQNFDYFIGIEAYAAFSNDKEVRFRGSSGGVFETIATWIIEEGGSVFASRFDNNLKLKGFEAKTKTEVQNLTKSKYLQSDVSYLFPIIKKRIVEEIPCLCCFTPCQIEALKKYLGNLCLKDNLILLDFFCHGVPSQDLFDRCIKYTENKLKIHILTYEFRTKKKYGTTPHYFTITYEKKGIKKKATRLYLKDPFYLGFQKYITMRESCYHCPFGKGSHSADITIGDFHEINRYVNGINRFEGVSTVIINTDKGSQVWKHFVDKFVLYEMDVIKLQKDNCIYTGGTQEPKKRRIFLEDLENLNFEEVVEKWFNSKNEIIKEVYYHLPSFIRKIARRIFID